VSEGWDPVAYLDEIRVEIPLYDELQLRAVEATRGLEVRRVLELGVGSGETARRVLALHVEAELVGIDGNESMLHAARAALPPERVDLRLGRLEEPLPEGPFDVVISVLAVHHLQPGEKTELFRRVAAVLAPGSRFVLADVVVPERPEDVVVRIEEGFDFPDRLADQVAWLEDAGFAVEVLWSRQDLAVVAADQPA
jgi:tRNA (cmo5U34)-methyltransferase